MCDVAAPIYNSGKSQNARLEKRFLTSCGPFEAKVATRPTDQSTLMVLRLLYDRHSEKAPQTTLKNLGYLPEQSALIRRMSQHTAGINILSGPTGSGKSSTLKCVLRNLLTCFDNKIYLLTIEDPPEYMIPGANQTPISCDKDDDEAISRTWSRLLSNAVRLDPDVMMISEVRDRDSAAAAFLTAMTGHGVWTTLHANDAVSILSRLEDTGIASSLLYDPSLITGLINQSLVRTLCQYCRAPYRLHDSLLADDLVERIERDCKPDQIWLGKDCDLCYGTGISGRRVVAEVIIPT